MTTFLASLGDRLIRFDLDAEGMLHRLGELKLESPIHYVWPHPHHRLLYVASSARSFTPGDHGHMLSVVEVPPDGGAMRRIGLPTPLRSRPIHVTLDNTGAYVLSLFNDPAGMQVHALAADGAVAGEVEQKAPLDFGVFPHQARLSPCNRRVLVAARGNDARPDRAEDPGSLRRYAFNDGQLDLAQVVAPGGGFGFGPRHIDFHPSLPCLYVSVERQSQLQVYRHKDGVIEDQPSQVISTLAPGKRPNFPQYGGAVHVAPDGGFVYVVNRDDPHVGKEESHVTGDNTMAAFRIDPATGGVSPPVHSELDAFHMRTFSLHPPFLVSASQADVTLPGPQGPRAVPASLGVFRMTRGGALEPVHRTLMPTGGSMLFWCGFPQAYGARWA